MALELKQQLKQTQQLLMSPQLQQAIKLLQMSHLELVDYVQQELMENPFLEEGSSAIDVSEFEHDFSQSPKKSEDKDEGYQFDEVSSNGDWENYLGELSSAPRISSIKDFDSLDDLNPLETRYASKTTLEAHLMWQLRLSKLKEHQVEIGEYVLGNIDYAGYLQATNQEIAEQAQCKVEDVEEVVRFVQRLDPVGIASRNPQECLLVQIEVLGYDRDPILTDLIKYHLNDLETHRYKPVMRKFKIDLEELKEYIDIIQSLNPMPGAAYGESEPIFVSPDVHVIPYENDFIIVLSDDLPALQINEFLNKDDKNMTGEVKDYSQKKITSATWLIKSLEQRRRTLYKVMESILKFQKEFFTDGVSKLKPLILKDISEDIEMHESSVSRITTNKYVATPHGTFELKFFFNSALESDDGNQVGSESVKALIKQMISKEDPKAPLADEKLCDLLKDELGVAIARRTVAKYRTALGIASSSKRKEHF